MCTAWMGSVGSRIICLHISDEAGIGVVVKGAGVSVWTAASGVGVSGVVAAGVGWQAPSPASKAKMSRQLNKDPLEYMLSLPSPMKKLLHMHSSYSVSTRVMKEPDKCLAPPVKLLVALWIVNEVTFILSCAFEISRRLQQKNRSTI